MKSNNKGKISQAKYIKALRTVMSYENELISEYEDADLGVIKKELSQIRESVANEFKLKNHFNYSNNNNNDINNILKESNLLNMSLREVGMNTRSLNKVTEIMIHEGIINDSKTTITLSHLSKLNLHDVKYYRGVGVGVMKDIKYALKKLEAY